MKSTGYTAASAYSYDVVRRHPTLVTIVEHWVGQLFAEGPIC
jgi:hypothetical protein